MFPNQFSVPGYSHRLSTCDTDGESLNDFAISWIYIKKLSGYCGYMSISKKEKKVSRA